MSTNSGEEIGPDEEYSAPQSADAVEDELTEIREENEELRKRVTELEADNERLDALVTGALDRIHELEDRLDDVESRSTTDTEMDDETPTPAQRAIEEYDETESDSSSKQRAVAILANYSDWCIKTQAGWVIRTREERLRDRLERELGEDLEWVQVYRACKKLENVTEGTIEYVDSDRKCLVAETHPDVLLGEAE
jgi:chromosome segregation ATPase